MMYQFPMSRGGMYPTTKAQTKFWRKTAVVESLFHSNPSENAIVGCCVSGLIIIVEKDHTDISLHQPRGGPSLLHSHLSRNNNI
jgi:hypothetical protein